MVTPQTSILMQSIGTCFLLILLLATTAQCQTNKSALSAVQSVQIEPQQILVLDSYQPGLPIPESIKSGILTALQEGGFSVSHLFFEHLDFVRAPTSEHRTDIANLLRHKLTLKHIGVVITIGAPAGDFMTKEGKSIFPDAMVIALIAPNYQTLSGAYDRVVNIPWRVDPSDTLRVALDLYPKTRRVFVVTGANDKILPFLDQVREAFAPWQGKLEIEYSNEMTYAGMLRRVSTLPSDAIVIYSPFFSDSTGQAFGPAEVIDKVCQTSTVPVFATLEEYLGRGIVGGSLLRTMDIGRKAGTVALDYLQGRLKLIEPVTTLVTNSLYEFDWRVLDRWKADISSLPKESLFINRPITLWGQYKVTVIAAAAVMLVMGLLVAILTIVNRRLKQMTIVANDSEARFRKMIDNAPEAIVLYDVDLKQIIDANHKAERLFGCDREELLQGGPERFYAPRQPDGKDIAESMDFNNQRVSKGEEVMFERNVHSYDNRDLVCEVRLSQLQYQEKHWFRASFIDITERKQMEKSLRESEERLEVIFETSKAGIILVSPSGTIDFANRRMAEIFGMELPELIGTLYTDHLHFSENRAGNKKMIQLFKGEIQSVWLDRRYIRKDGSDFWGDMSGSRLENADGTLRGLVGVISDITDRKQAEEDRQKIEMLNSIGTLAGGIAHDFNNILAGLYGNVSLAKSKLTKSLPDHPGFRYLEAAEKSMNRATALTNRLLTFAKGGVPLKETFSLSHLIEEVVPFNLSGSNVKPVISQPDNLWLAFIDQGQIQQVFGNLTINAKQAMPSGGELQITLENIEISNNLLPGLNGGKYIRISLSDNGIGITPAHLGRIFDPYFTTKQSGNGLGLATVYSIIKKHGGHISVTSQLGQGTTFTLYLPTAKDQKLPPVPTVSVSAALQQAARVLVMDDDGMICDIVEHVLQDAGFTIETVPDGTQAIARYRQTLEDGTPFDLVILDLTIPGSMGGKEVVTQILALHPQAKVIVSSGYADDPVMSNYADYGFKGAAAKPYELGTLVNIANKILMREPV